MKKSARLAAILLNISHVGINNEENYTNNELYSTEIHNNFEKMLH